MRQLKGLLVLAALAATLLPAMQARGQDTLRNRLIFLGDTHYDRLEDHDLVWLQANYPDDYRQVQQYTAWTADSFGELINSVIAQSGALHPRGIVHTGDLQEGLAGSSALATQMARHATEALRAPDCPTPYVLIKGNHDITGPGATEAYQSVILPFASSELGQSLRNTYYSWRSGDIEVFAIDCYDLGALSTFLKPALAASTAKYKFIATHQPVIPVTGRLWNIYQGDSAAHEELLNLIASYKAVVLCGHLHYFSVVRRLTASGPVVQVMTNSVIRDRSRTTPYWSTADYGPSLVDLEPSFDPSSRLSRMTALAAESKYVTGFYLADMPGYTVIDINDTTGEMMVRGYCGTARQPYKEISLAGYNLKVDTAGHGSVLRSPAGPSYLANMMVTLTAQPALGWTFSGWSGSLTGAHNPDSLLMNTDKAVTAAFTQLPAGQTELRVTVAGDGAVELSPPGPYFSQGTVVKMTARPGAGSIFDAWSGDATGKADTLSVLMDTHKAVTASFRALAIYQLQRRALGDGQVTVSPAAAAYAETSWVSVQATPGAGWEFAGWSGSLSGMQNPMRLSMQGEREVKALFRKGGSQLWTLDPAQDSYVRGSLYATRNFNTDSLILVREGTSDLYRSRGLIQFNLSAIAPTLKVVQAVLRLHSRKSAAFPDGVPARVDALAAGGDAWTEQTLTWKTQPAGEGAVQDSTTAMAENDRLYCWDVTALVKQELTGDHIVSFLLKDRAGLDHTAEFDSRETAFPPLLEVLTDVASSVPGPEGAGRPYAFRLEQNYPNPFNPATWITYELAATGPVRLAVYDLTGREAACLVSASQGPGRYQARFDATGLSSGVYICRLKAGRFVQSRSMLVLK